MTYPAVWPLGLTLDDGFSDSELEELAGPSHGSREGLPRSAVPWLFFASEMYSHGKTLRSFLGWPVTLPIPVFSDHGVAFQPQLIGPEEANASRVHLSWSSWRGVVPQGKKRRALVGCVHPWVPYRRTLGVKRNRDAQGTLLFVPHSVPGHLAEDYDFGKYFDDANRLPPAFRPRAICIAMHDVHLGLHRSLRKFGLPIVSAGNSASPLFVERFYDIVRRFSFATSPTVGTQTFICEELGVEYFLFGERPKRPASIIAMPNYAAGADRELFVESNFRHLPGENGAKKQELVRSALNLDLDIDATRRRLRRIFWRELILMTPYIFRQFFVYAKRQWL